MSRTATAVLAFIGLPAIAFMLVGCDGFFVSPNALGSFTVSPPAAYLSAGASGVQLSANGLNNNGDSTSVSPNWTSSDTTCTSISFSSSGCTATTTGAPSVTVTPIAAGTATITASASGAASQTVYISVITGTISGITATISPTTVSSGGQTSESVAASNGSPIPCQYVNWGSPPSGTSFTCSNNSNSLTITISSVAGTVTGLTGGQVTIPEPSVTTNGNQTLQPQNFSGTVTVL